MRRTIFLSVCICGALALNITIQNGRKGLLVNMGRLSIGVGLKSKIPNGHILPMSGSGSASHHLKGAWVVPDFYGGWEVYSKMLPRYKEALKIQNKSHINTLAFLYTMHGLTKNIIDAGWDFYKDSYKSIAKLYPIEAMNDPVSAAKVVRCYMDAVMDRVKQISVLLDNYWIKFVCNEKPEACNPSIYIIMKMSENSELEKEAEFLLSFITYGKQFIKDFRRIFREASKDPVKLIENSGKDGLVPLLATNLEVQGKLFEDGDVCIKINRTFAYKKNRLSG